MYSDEYKKTLGVAFLEKNIHVKKLGKIKFKINY